MKINVKFEETNRGFNAQIKQDNVQFKAPFSVLVGGKNGKSAYEIAVDNGFEGTEQEWLESLKPRKGVDYFTEADIVYIVNAVLAALGSGGGGETEDSTTAELDKAILDMMILV